MAGDDKESFRNRPRRRGAALEEAIIDAVTAELTEVGYAGMTMESVARRAGTGKVAIYRRWPTRLALAIEAAYRLMDLPEPPPEPSTLRADLVAWLTAVAGQMAGPAGEAFRGIVAESLTHVGRGRLADVTRGTSLEQFRQILDRARQRGEPVRDDLTPMQERVPSSLLQHHYLTHHLVDQDYIEHLIDEVVIPLITPL
ncbi:MAG: TetR/AcrR family transcriptional regulator [Micropruina sp.]|uniref:TetR/AcrR family transcriptional regulator n=1 Tax=Micropruina sp. TaxID=2737536 RepID=UPI0039E2E8BE